MERKPRLRQKFQKLWVTSSPGSHLETAVDLGILGEKTNHDVAAFAIDSLRSPGGVFTKISSKRPWGGMEVGTQVAGEASKNHQVSKFFMVKCW